MERLPLRDLRSLLDVVRDVYAIRTPVRTPAAFVDHFVHTLPRLIPAELTFYAEGQAGATGFVPGHMTADDPQYLPEIEAMVVGGRTYRDHPFTRHLVAGWRGEPIRLSDFRTRREHHRTALYDEEFRRLGIEYQMSCLFRLPPRIQTLVLDRTHRDFSERERLMLALLRPHVAQARQNAEHLGALADTVADATAVLAAEDRAAILLTQDRRVRWCSPRAATYLARYCRAVPASGGSLPAPLDGWLRLHQAALAKADVVPAPCRPLTLEQEGAALIIRCLAEPERHCLLLEERRSAPTASSLAQLGLTPREADVLAWLAQGKSNADIGTILGMRPKTVSKHLERIYQKLGVETRTAAAAMVLAPPAFSIRHP